MSRAGIQEVADDKSFNEKLREHQAAFNVHKFDKTVMPEVLYYNYEWRKENPTQFLYNSILNSYILSKETVSAELFDYLDTEVYLSQQQYRKDKEAKTDATMLELGYTKITPNISYRGVAEIVASQEVDLFKHSVKSVGKIIDGNYSAAFFIPKGKRTRGYSFLNLKGYYKPLKN